jgi:hypothetical protein
MTKEVDLNELYRQISHITMLAVKNHLSQLPPEDRRRGDNQMPNKIALDVGTTLESLTVPMKEREEPSHNFTQWEFDIAPGYDGRYALGPRHHETGKIYELYFEIQQQARPESFLVMEGSLGWDGCLNVWYTESREDTRMQHFCDEEDLDKFSQALKWVWTKGPKIETWNDGI